MEWQFKKCLPSAILQKKIKYLESSQNNYNLQICLSQKQEFSMQFKRVFPIVTFVILKENDNLSSLFTKQFEAFLRGIENLES